MSADRDVTTAARNLYDALMRARGYVAKAADPDYLGEPASEQPAAADVLEQVDGALAEAGDVLDAVPA